MRRPLVVHVVGARPNYMKVAPVYAELARSGRVEQRLVHTGQHYDREVSDVFFAELPLPAPHAKLKVGSGTHAEQTARALVELETLFARWRPDLVVVPGDVNSTLAAALAAAKLDIPVCHLEAGLRSFDRTMPEEHNRRLTDHLSTLLMTHSEDANENLAAEGIDDESIAFVGNTMIDTLLVNIEAARERAAWNDYGLEQRNYVLVTLHRARLVDDPVLIRKTVEALEQVAAKIPVLFPVHPRTRSRLAALNGSGPKRVQLAPPLPYVPFLSLQAGAAAIVTDSGGIQEESTALGVRCFTLRDNTERPVTVTHGTNEVMGLDPSALALIPERLEKPRKSVVPPLWDGRAGARAAASIERLLGVVPVSTRVRRSAAADGRRLAVATANEPTL
jgi:UDP-N-acetylglucosamine 2-epimerase (non-hydrolysing)